MSESVATTKDMEVKERLEFTIRKRCAPVNVALTYFSAYSDSLELSDWGVMLSLEIFSNTIPFCSATWRLPVTREIAVNELIWSDVLKRVRHGRSLHPHEL